MVKLSQNISSLTPMPVHLKNISIFKIKDVILMPKSPECGFNPIAALVPSSSSLAPFTPNILISDLQVFHSKCKASRIPSALNAFLLHFVLLLFTL